MTIQELRHHHDPYPVWNVFNEATGNLTFDVGANIGQSTRLLAKGFTNVIAFEPCRESYEILKAEMPLNVVTRQMAVTDHDGTLELFEAARSIQTGQLVSHEGLHWGDIVGSRHVLCSTLDSLAIEFGFPDMLKCDVEGHEVEVVKGGPETMKRCPKAVIEIHKAENGQIVRDLLPEWEWLEVRHPLRIESPVRQNHYWLIGTNHAL